MFKKENTMSFQLTAEQRMVQKMAREFARKELLPLSMERDKSKEFPGESLAKMGDLGFLGMMVPPEYDGAGADTVSYAAALSEIAYACASTAVVMSVHNSIVCESLLKFGSRDQKDRYLGFLARGEWIGAFAMTEPLAGSDPVRQETTAVKTEKGWLINGVKRFITSGKNAELIGIDMGGRVDQRGQAGYDLLERTYSLAELVGDGGGIGKKKLFLVFDRLMPGDEDRDGSEDDSDQEKQCLKGEPLSGDHRPTLIACR